EPEIKEFNGGILVTLYKDHLSKDLLRTKGLSEKQIKAIQYVKDKGKITNKEYQVLCAVSRYKATLDLRQLVEKKVFKSSSLKGAGSYYEI
ncbi:MAG: transcriptional regulator, partial [Flavobacteriaceae bacterium]|nr:transcriptional regulator [Flavobacteriaceae bacterium]MCY4253951.1 transcriptional regulator [Flavobacteriaceae bacterium]